MQEWMRNIERQLVAARGLSGLARDIAVREITKERQEGAAGTNRPTAPIELTYQTAFYIDRQGRRRSRFLMDFPDVTKSIQAEDITVFAYELWGQDVTKSVMASTTDAEAGEAAPGLTLPGLTTTEQSQAIEAEPEPWKIIATNYESFFREEGFYPGSFWKFKARALSASSPFPGDFSVEITVQMHEDLTPPPQLTAPILTVDRGVISARWDGMTVLGTTPPADFKYAVLAHGTASSPTTEIVRFSRGGGTQIVTAPYYQPQYFRLAAVDESGNMGPWSEQATAITTPLVDTDVILSRIDGAETILENIDAGVAILPNTIISEHIVVTQELTGRMAQFLEVDAGMLKANEIWADTAWLGYANAKLVVADMFEGKQFTGGTFIGSTFKTSVEEYSGITWTSDGIKAYNNAGLETFSLSASTGRAKVYGRLGTGPVGQPGAFLLPAEDSQNGLTTGVFITHDGALTGQITAGMWVADSTSTVSEYLNLRGLHGGAVRAMTGLRVEENLTLASHPTTSAAANAVIAVSPYGVVYRSTSSLRYKTDVQGWDPDYRALELAPSSWVDRNPMDPSDPLQRYYGLIAEQVHEVMPELVVYNEHGEPDAVQYERLAVALVPVVRDLLRRIEILEGAN
jgi:hypothetical protein